jgi:hypothetical protein
MTFGLDRLYRYRRKAGVLVALLALSLSVSSASAQLRTDGGRAPTALTADSLPRPPLSPAAAYPAADSAAGLAWVPWAGVPRSHAPLAWTHGLVVGAWSEPLSPYDAYPNRLGWPTVPARRPLLQTGLILMVHSFCATRYGEEACQGWTPPPIGRRFALPPGASFP